MKGGCRRWSILGGVACPGYISVAGLVPGLEGIGGSSGVKVLWLGCLDLNLLSRAVDGVKIVNVSTIVVMKGLALSLSFACLWQAVVVVRNPLIHLQREMQVKMKNWMVLWLSSEVVLLCLLHQHPVVPDL